MRLNSILEELKADASRIDRKIGEAV